MTDGAIFRREGELFVPGPDACGPWSPDLMHGGPPFGLIARAIEGAVPDAAFVPARITFDLFRPVPLVPLGVETTVLRRSSRLCLLHASLVAGGEEYVRATALLLAQSDVEEAPPSAAEDRPVGPEGLAIESLMRSRSAPPPNTAVGFHVRVQTRWVPREADEALAIWFRLPVAMVAGEEASSFQRATALCDFANAVASIAESSRDGSSPPFINADATVYFFRRPLGEWVCLKERGVRSVRGVSVAEVAVFDSSGLCGSVSQARLAQRSR